MARRIGLIALVALLGVAGFSWAETGTVTISGNGPVFDTSVDVTYGFQKPDSNLWLKEYWNNDYAGFGAYDCRPLIRMDLSAIPANKKIDSVSFNVKVIYASNATASYCDLWKVHPFTDAVSAWKYDGVNDWPTKNIYYDVSYFDGIDGYYYVDPYSWEYAPPGMHLATSDIAINEYVSDQWMSFTGSDLTSYIQTQSNQAAGSRFAYFEISFEDESASWAEFYSNESGDPSLFPYLEVTYSDMMVPGDANSDGKVDVSDLGILAANYGMTSGATWDKGDFNGDGKVDVSDLGILAANYGTGAASSADFAADYAKVFGTAADAEASAAEEKSISLPACGGLGLTLVAGLALAGLLLVKFDE